MPTLPAPAINKSINGADKRPAVSFHSSGSLESAPSAGASAVIKKGAQSQVLEVHGTIAGCVFDNPA